MWRKWECYPAGFYEDNPPKGMKSKEAIKIYEDMLKDLELFEKILQKVIIEWTYSCEHYLSNENMNRIAWLGQAALAYKYNIPAQYRVGYHNLTEEQQMEADKMALKYLNKWLEMYNEPELTLEEAKSKTIPNLY